MEITEVKVFPVRITTSSRHMLRSFSTTVSLSAICGHQRDNRTVRCHALPKEEGWFVSGHCPPPNMETRDKIEKSILESYKQKIANEV
jgi:hypothetical protein